LGARVDAKLMRGGLLWRAAKKAIVRLIVSTEAAAGQVEPHSSLRSELAQLRLSALQQRATTVGIEPAAIEGALNSDEPKQRLVDIIVMCEERSARSAGAIDVGAASPKQSMIELLLEAAAGVGGAASPALTGANAAQEAAAAKAALVAELAALRPTQLRKRAVAAGVSSEQIESAEDSDTPRESLTELIVGALSDAAVTSPVPVVSKPAAATTTGRGHFGSRQKLHQPLRKMPPGFIPNGQHCMLSYQWDVQETVSRVRKALQAKGVKCWM
jgi:hypothetical protein